jgi:thiamine pyrophosphokinase
MNDSDASDRRNFVVLLGGEISDVTTIGVLPNDARVIAADSGLHLANALGLEVEAVVGDMDSVDTTALAAVEALGTNVLRFLPDKDASDAELALSHAASLGASHITVVAGRSNRLDHELGNFAVLFLEELRNCEVELRLAGARVFRLDAHDGQASSLCLDCLPGDVVGLLPFGGNTHGVTVSGLHWALSNESLAVNSSRGISNRAVEHEVFVSIESGRLLITVTKGAQT